LPRDRWILNTFVPRSMRRAARVIAVSESTRRDILRTYKGQFPPEHVVTILEAADPRYQPPVNGQESARIEANERYTLGNAPYILAVGVLQPRKNLTTLLDAFGLIKLGPRPLPHKLVIVGKRGWKNEALDQKIASLPEAVSKEIVWTGYVPDDDLPLLYGGAAAFCYPSLYEGFGLPPLQAMAAGVPVVATAAGAVPEVVGDGAWLVPSGDGDALAARLVESLDGGEAVDALVARGRARATDFSWERCADGLVGLYRDAAAARDSVVPPGRRRGR